MATWYTYASTELFEPLLFLQLKIIAVVCVAWLVEKASRDLAPSFRHTLWSAALVSILLLPAIEGIVPSIHLEAPASASVPVAASELPPEALVLDRAVILEASPSVSAGIPLQLSWLALYVVGLVWFAARRFVALASVWRVSARATRVRQGEAQSALRRAARAVGLSRLPRLLRSAEIRSAYTWGTARPLVLVPESSRSWSEQRWEAVLLHELSHIRGRDWLRLVLGEIACCLHWMNPAVWFAVRRLSFERERACDAAVLQHGLRPSDYAAHLLEIARGKRDERQLEMAALSARGAGLEGRIRAILARKPILQTSKALTAFATALVFGASTAFAAVDPDAPPAEVVEAAASQPAVSEAPVVAPVKKRAIRPLKVEKVAKVAKVAEVKDAKPAKTKVAKAKAAKVKPAKDEEVTIKKVTKVKVVEVVRGDKAEARTEETVEETEPVEEVEVEKDERTRVEQHELLGPTAVAWAEPAPSESPAPSPTPSPSPAPSPDAATSDTPESTESRFPPPKWERRARKPLDVSGLKPTVTHSNGYERYDIYVVKREDGGYATKVCVRYRETGSRVWRNSCRRNVPRSMSFTSPIWPTSYTIGRVGQIPPVHSNAVPEMMARRLEAAFTVALNGDVDIIDLDNAKAREIIMEETKRMDWPKN